MRPGSPMLAARRSAARVSVSAGHSSTSDDDIDASFALDDLVSLEPERRIGRAFAGLELVFPAVPGADDMRLVRIIGLAQKGAVRSIEVDDLIAHDPFAGRSALMQAMISIGVEGAGMAIDA